MIERRAFLKGMLASVSAGTALVTLATPEETTALVVQQPVMLGQPKHHMPNSLDQHVYVRMPNGVFLAIGIITQITTNVSVEDIVSWDGTVVLIPGLKRGELKFEGQF